MLWLPCGRKGQVYVQKSMWLWAKNLEIRFLNFGAWAFIYQLCWYQCTWLLISFDHLWSIDSIATKVSLSEVQTCCELRWCRQQRLWRKRPGAGAKMGQQLYLGGFEMVPAVSCFGLQHIRHISASVCWVHLCFINALAQTEDRKLVS